VVTLEVYYYEKVREILRKISVFYFLWLMLLEACRSVQILNRNVCLRLLIFIVFFAWLEKYIKLEEKLWKIIFISNFNTTIPKMTTFYDEIFRKNKVLKIFSLCCWFFSILLNKSLKHQPITHQLPVIIIQQTKNIFDFHVSIIFLLLSILYCSFMFWEK